MEVPQQGAMAMLAFLGALGGCAMAAANKPRLAIAWAIFCCAPAFVALYIKAVMG